MAVKDPKKLKASNRRAGRKIGGTVAIFVFLLILGGSAVIHPLNMGHIDLIDYTAVFACALSLVLFAWTGVKNRIDRLEGVILVLLQILYFAYLFIMK